MNVENKEEAPTRSVQSNDAVVSEKQNNSTASYDTSKDYDELYKVLCDGVVVAGFCDHGINRDPNIELPKRRNICQIKRTKPFDIDIFSQGISYAGVYTWEEAEKAEVDLLKNNCEYLNLEWIPLNR